ncbi:MAG: rhomboid family intramembrane serine protease [Aureispira sp.]|nr:rhomboid family intramembrane serine protease [Aureispira sp.]
MMALKVKYNAPVVLTFSLVCIIVFYLDKWVFTSLIDNNFVLFGRWSPTNPMDYFRLLSNTMGHASQEHIIGNLSIFLLIAPMMEEKYGSRQIAMMILVTAVASGLLHVFFFDHGVLGASGLVFMFIVLSSFADVKKGSIPMTFILVAIFYLGSEVIHSFENDQISQFGHITGGVLGAIFGFIIPDAKSSAEGLV